MRQYFKLVRINQWPKNVLVGLPALGAGVINNPNDLKILLSAVIVFILSSSLIYILNDLKDLSYDKNHRTKSKRPLASGEISLKNAHLFGIGIFGLLLLLISNFRQGFLVILVYIFVNIFYSLGAKSIPILELFLVSSGYVLRVIYGAMAFEIQASNWLLLCVFTGSFGLIASKRYSELRTAELELRASERIVLLSYSEASLRTIFLTSWISTFVTFSIWSLESRTFSYLALTSCLLFFSIIVILIQEIEKNNLEEPELLIRRYDVMALCALLSITIILLVG